jgi:hypothetical protein
VNEPIAKPEEMFEVKQLPKEFFTSDYLSDITDPYFQTKDLKAKVELKKGEFVTRRFLGAPEVTIGAEAASPATFKQVIINGDRVSKRVLGKVNGEWVVVSGDSGTGSGTPPDASGAPSTPGTRPGNAGQ